MGEYILPTIKKMLGLDVDDQSFDLDIIVCINSAIMALTQIGVGPSSGFVVTSENDRWDQLIGNKYLEPVKLYVYMKTRLAFDPPNSSVTESMKQQIKQIEWRTLHQLQSGGEDSE